MALDPEKEFEGLYRTHDLDDPKFIAFVKKTAKTKTKTRINKYFIFEIIDGKMLKLEIEGFTITNKAKGIVGGISKGTRTIKGYLSDKVCDEMVAILDAVPRKSIQDTRTMEFFDRPEKIIVIRNADVKELDLENLFND